MKSVIQNQRIRLRGLVLAWCLLGLVEQVLLAQNDAQPDSANRTSRERKFVNKIPYDVFFDRPLELIRGDGNAESKAAPNKSPEQQPRPVGIDSDSTPPANSLKPKSAGSKAASAAWHDLLPLEELQSEIKSIRSNLTKSVSSQGQFNQHFKQLAVDGAELASLAVIASEHPDHFSWKERAHFVREFASQINKSAIGLGKENFDRSKAAVQRLTSVLDGSVPPDAGDVAVTQPFHECATRKGLMKRIEKTRDWLKLEVNSESRFKSKSDQIRHEAAIMSALTTVVTQPGYEYTENNDYQSFARSLIEASQEIRHAIDDGSYDKFKSAIDKVNKSCTDCHGSYGNG